MKLIANIEKTRRGVAVILPAGVWFADSRVERAAARRLGLRDEEALRRECSSGSSVLEGDRMRIFWSL